MMTRFKINYRVPFFLATLFGLNSVLNSQLIQAQTFGWINTTNNNSYWHVDSNWTPTGPPDATETAQFNANREFEVWWDSVTVNTTPEVGFLNMTAGDVRFNNLTTNRQHEMRINGNNALSDLSVSGANTVLDFRGLHLHSLGGARIINGATLVVDGSYARGTNLSIDSQGFQTGFNVSGTLNVHSGGMVTSHWGKIGWNSSDSGSATITGNGSIWDSFSIKVGNYGNGTLNVEAEGAVSTSYATVGYLSGSSGTALVTGTDSRWDNANNLFVGFQINSNGTLDVEDGGVVTTNNSFIGRESGSTGLVNVSGSDTFGNASRLDSHATLEVGHNGNGTLNVGTGGVVTDTFGYVGRESGSIGVVNVGGAGSSWSNILSLGIGGDDDAEGGNGELNINSGGLVTVGIPGLGTTKIWSTGTVNLNGGRFEFRETSIPEFNRINASSGSMAGNLNHSGFTDVNSLTALQNTGVDLTDVTLTNSGTLFGNAILGNSLINQAGGEIQTVSVERMRFAGSGTNAGEFNNFGGTILFAQDVTNSATGFITGRGVFGADGGWANEGVMAFSAGISDVLGDVHLVDSGQIVTSGGATTTLFDDVVHNGSEIRTAAGSNTVFFGAVSGAGGFTGTGTVFFEGDLRPGNSPDIVDFEGDVVLGSQASSYVELAGQELGEYDRLNIAGDFSIDGELFVDLIDGFQLSSNQQFLIADVGNNLTGQFGGFDEGGLVGSFGGRDLFITYAAGDGNDVGLFTSVPEPGACTMCAIGLFGFALFYRRRKRA